MSLLQTLKDKLWIRRKRRELQDASRQEPMCGVGSSVPIPGGEYNGDCEPAETFVMPEQALTWEEIEKELNR